YAQKRTEQARVHFERAFDLEPSMLLAANNLAWLLAHEEPTERIRVLGAVLGSGAARTQSYPEAANLQRALDMIENVVKQAPKQPSFRETRGQILVKLGRWKEAVSDLEFALPLLPNKRPIHLSLAKAYQELGLAELAQEHRKLAKPERP